MFKSTRQLIVPQAVITSRLLGCGGQLITGWPVRLEIAHPTISTPLGLFMTVNWLRIDKSNFVSWRRVEILIRDGANDQAIAVKRARRVGSTSRMHVRLIIVSRDRTLCVPVIRLSLNEPDE